MDNVTYKVSGLMAGGFVSGEIVFHDLTRDQLAKMFNCSFSMLEAHVNSGTGWRGMLISAGGHEYQHPINYGDYTYSLYNAGGDLVDTHQDYEHIGIGIGEMCELIGCSIPWVGALFQEIPVGVRRLRRTLAFRVPSSLYKGEPDLICGNCAGRGRDKDSILSLNIQGGVYNKGCIVCECTRPGSFSLREALRTTGSNLEENTSAMSALNLFCPGYKREADRSSRDENQYVVFDIFDGVGTRYSYKTAAHALIDINPEAVRLDRDFTLNEYIINYNRGLCAYAGCGYRSRTVIGERCKIPSNPLHQERILKVLRLMDLK